MDNRDRLSYYKLLQAQGIALSAPQQADMLLITRERGIASAGPMPAGGEKHTEAKIKL